MSLRHIEVAVSVVSMALCHQSVSAQERNPDMVLRAREVVQRFERVVRPLEIQSNLAWWDANTTGKDEDFARKEQAENQLNAALGDRPTFEQLKSLRETKLEDPVLQRQIEVLYLRYLEKQVDPELLRQMTAKANQIEQAFNVFRTQVGTESLSDSQVRQCLSESKDSARRQAVWEACKGVGSVVSDDLKELVQLRNEAARKLGFSDYHTMQLSLNEQDPGEVLRLFDQLDALTREPFQRSKAEIDRRLAASYGITVEQLRPWHYHDPFFQESPKVDKTDVDTVFREVDILQLCRDFYAGIGLPVDEVLSRSDLYERPGKNPHAFLTDIDREGDVRVLANIVPNEYWTSTMLHELGHGVYSSRFIPASVPYALRTDAHILCTEGVAMMFERFCKNSQWLQGMGVTVADPQSFDEAGRRMRRDQLLIFSRWCQVMLRFEREMYTRPDQDLNDLWWDLVERYQGLHRPEGRDAPDYASKIHVVSAPAYYHNYMMGELFACQLHAAVARDVLQAPDPTTAIYYDNPAVGRFMIDKVFAHGRLLPWNELTRQATGAALNAQAFAAEFGATSP